jgi:hypothetical protein
MGLMSKVDVLRRYPAVERAGARAEAKPSRMALCACSLLMNLQVKVWSPYGSWARPHQQSGRGVSGRRGRRSFRLRHRSKIQGGRRLVGLLRQRAIRG